MNLSLAHLKKRFFRRLQKSTVLGIDFGSSVTKVVRLEVGDEGSRPALASWCYPEKILASNPTSVQQFFQFLDRQRLAELPVAASLSDPSLRITRLDLPKMPEFDLKEAIKWQLRDQIEGSTDQYSFRHIILDEYPSGEGQRLAVMAYSVRRDAVRERMTLLRRLSLKPVLLEPTAVALLASVDRIISWEHGAFVGLLDLGESHAEFYAAMEGKLYFARPMPDLSAVSLTRLAVQEGGISEAEGESLLKPAGDGSASLNALLPLFYGRIAVEIQRSLDAFALLFHQRRVERLFFTGGLSGLPGLLEATAKNVGIKTERISPFEGWPVEVTEPSLYAAAVGLVLHASPGGGQ